jgi:hypothetical protein
LAAVTFEDLQGQRFQDNLREAAGFKPLLPTDLDEAYKRYETVGVKRGRVANKSDSQLYKMATDDVLAWFKKSKADEAARLAAQKQAEAQRVAQAARQQEEARRQQEAAARAAAATYAGRSSSASASGLLPDTAAGGDAPSALQVSLLQKPTPQYVEQQFARYNLWGARPPAYAMTTVGAFDQWVRSAVRWLEENRRRQSVAIRTSSGYQVVNAPITSARNPSIR